MVASYKLFEPGSSLNLGDMAYMLAREINDTFKLEVKGDDSLIIFKNISDLEFNPNYKLAKYISQNIH